MNPIRRIPLHVLMLAGLLSVSEAAAEDKAAKPEARAAAPAAPEAKLQAYSGVSTSAYDKYYREEQAISTVDIPEGVGLVVGFVDPQGPAVGKLESKDILTRLDDQVLVNPEQFRALVQTRKPGDTIKLVRVRGDDIETVELTLAGKPAPAARASRSATRQPDVADNDPMPSGAAGIRIMINGQEIDPGQMIQGNAVPLPQGGQGNVIVINPNTHQLPPEARKMLEDMRRRGLPVPPDMMPAPGADPAVPGASQHVTVRSFSFGGGIGPGVTSTSSSMYSDGDGTVQVRKEGDKKFATVKDADGKVVFDGEITTDEQLKAVPAEARGRITLADGGKIRLPGMPGQVQDDAPDADKAADGKKLEVSPKPAAKKKPRHDPREGA